MEKKLEKQKTEKNRKFLERLGWVFIAFIFCIPASILSNQLVLEPAERSSFWITLGITLSLVFTVLVLKSFSDLFKD
jgi:hypothetical protein